MFNLFRNKKLDEAIEKIKEEPYVEPERTYYSIGPSTKGRVVFRLSYNNISMDEVGIDALIKVLESSKVWLEPDKDDSGKQPEDGLPTEGQPV